jgi:sugar phosphate isomerase/epimerase
LYEMKPGFSTRAYHPAGWSIAEVLAHASQHVDLVEVWLEPPYLQSWRTSREKTVLEQVREILLVRGMQCSIHAGKTDLNLASLNPIARKAAREDLGKAFEWAGLLEASIVTFHPGKIHHDEAKAVEFLRQELARIDAKAGEYGFTVCIENQGKPGTLCRNSRQLTEVFEPLENIKLTLDLAHIILVREDPAQFMDNIKDYVRHLHVSDMDAAQGRHQPLGEVGNDYGGQLALLCKTGFDGAVILEGLMHDPVHQVEKQLASFKKMAVEAGFKI